MAFLKTFWVVIFPRKPVDNPDPGDLFANSRYDEFYFDDEDDAIAFLVEHIKNGSVDSAKIQSVESAEVRAVVVP